MKFRLGLPVLDEVSFFGLLKHYFSTVLFTGIGYFLIVMIFGLINGDMWQFVQSSDKSFSVQFFSLFLGLVIGHLMKMSLNNIHFKFFFLYPKLDKFLIPIGFVIAVLVILEKFGF